MYLVIVFLTLISFLSVGFFGRFFGFYGSALLATSCLILAFLVSVFIFYEVVFIGCFSYIKFISWMSSEILNVDWGFMFDNITSVMCCVVTFISCLVHLHSTGYMSYDPHLPEFMSYLSLFTFFMFILLTAHIFIHYKSVDYATLAALTPFLKTDVINFLNFNVMENNINITKNVLLSNLSLKKKSLYSKKTKNLILIVIKLKLKNLQNYKKLYKKLNLNICYGK